MSSKKIQTKKGFLDIYRRDDWIPFYNMYLSGEILSIPDMAEYLGIGYKVVLGVFDRFNLTKLTTSELSKRCVVKNKKTKLEKYGDGNYNNPNKTKKTKLEKYGDENYYNLEKANKTRLKKYGDENYRNHEKAKKTNLEKYGDEYYRNLEKIKKTKLEKYGDKNYNNSEKIKKTKLEKYGNCGYNNRKRAIKTCLLKYGTENPAKYITTKQKMRISIISKTLSNWQTYLLDGKYELLDDFEGTHASRFLKEESGWKKYNFIHTECGTEFRASFNENNIRCPKCYPKYKSLKEDDYSKFILKYSENIFVDLSNQSAIHPYEIDIFLPELNIGFEYNGDYWHSTAHQRIHENYHKNKTELALSKGIKLYHIWEHDNENIVKSMVCGLLNKNINNLHARKLKINKVESKERQIFFDTNHLHGDVKAKLAYGLYNGDELVSCISFRSHKEGIEIARFATKLHNRVRGGFSKLLKNSIPELKKLNYNKIITYCDRDWTPDYKDSVYYKNGFKFVKDTGCSLFYAQGSKIFSRETFQKHKLKQLFPDSYDDNKTANEILAENNILPCHNSGNWKFELDI